MSASAALDLISTHRPGMRDLICMNRSISKYHILLILDPRQIALLRPLQRQRSNDSCPDPGPILRSPDIDWVLLALWPIQNLS